MARKIGVGMIGAGFMGKTHSNAYFKVHRFFKMDAEPEKKVLCALPEAAVKAFADQWSWKEWSANYKEVVKRDDLELIDVNTPNNLHVGISTSALETGKRVVCEKPLAMTWNECEHMAAARKSCKKNMISSDYRRVPARSPRRRSGQSRISPIALFRFFLGGGEPPEKSVIVYLDLSRSQEIMRHLEVGQKLGPLAAFILRQQVLGLVQESVEQVGLRYEKVFVKSTGDGAILSCQTSSDADRIAGRLHHLAYEKHNLDAIEDTEYRCFRIGIYRGQVIRSAQDIDGLAVGCAQRLENAARTGEIVMDAVSWGNLPPEHQHLYGSEEIVRGKPHDKPIPARRRKVVEPAPWERAA